MPTYVYKFVDTGETIEIQQSFHDDSLTEAVHPQTGETLPVKKVFQPVGVTFKGDGFYKTDSRASTKKQTDGAASTSSDSTSSDSKSSKSAESSSSKPGTSSGGSSGGSGSSSAGTSTSSAPSKSTSSTSD